MISAKAVERNSYAGWGKRVHLGEEDIRQETTEASGKGGLESGAGNNKGRQ